MSPKCTFVFPCLTWRSCFITWCKATLDWHRFLWQIKYRSNKSLSGKREVDQLVGYVISGTYSWKSKNTIAYCHSQQKLLPEAKYLQNYKQDFRWFSHDCYLLSKWYGYETTYAYIWMMSNELNIFSVTWKKS